MITKADLVSLTQEEEELVRAYIVKRDSIKVRAYCKEHPNTVEEAYASKDREGYLTKITDAVNADEWAPIIPKATVMVVLVKEIEKMLEQKP